MIEIPKQFQPHIFTDYPTENKKIFEEWFGEQSLPIIDREYLKIYWTSYLVNHNWGNDVVALHTLQKFVDQLPRDKKYFTVVQFDDGCMVDFKDLDIVTFGMSYRLLEQKPTYCIPLIGQMGERLNLNKKYIANFVGNITHPMRKQLVDSLSELQGYYISTNNHNVNDFKTVVAQSEFTLCPVGYGKTSFRFYEAIHYNSIPVFIYEDELLEPYGIDINEYAIKIKSENIPLIPEILASFSAESLLRKQNKMNELYKDLCTYEGVYNKIIETLHNDKLD